jgi:uncharacterized protein YjbI with pentapeptide repeats
MDTAMVGSVELVLPSLPPDDELTPRDTLPDQPEKELLVADTSLRELRFSSITQTRVSRVTAERATGSDFHLASVVIEGCAWTALNWSACRLSRVVIRDCQLFGAVFSDVRMENVLFDRCRLDYAALEDVQAAGPLAFVGCSLVEATISGGTFAGAVFNDCRLDGMEVVGGRFEGSDFGGSNVAGIRGVINLRGASIRTDQVPELAEALLRELEIEVNSGS